jgi:hypothetical protein
MQEIEAGFGATCQMEITKFAGRETIEITIAAKNSEVILIRLFRTNGLHFTITYGAPNKVTFSTHLGEVDRSLETIEPLHGITDDYDKKLERMSQQEIARDLRLAELSADVYDINKANKIIADLLRKYPNNKDVQKMADALEKLSKNKK